MSIPVVTLTEVTFPGPVASIETGDRGVTFCAAEKSVYTPLSEENLAFTHLEFVFKVIIFAGEMLSK